MRYIVITGNPVTGFKFYGPFKTRDLAKKWANRMDSAGLIGPWVIGAVQSPK